MRLKSFYDGANTANYTYDDNGNTKTISGRFTDLDYDNLNRLRQITYNGGHIDKYWYNSAGLRFKKEEDVSGSNIVVYSMYRGNNPVIQEKYDGATLIETRFNIISGGQILGHIRKIYGTSENYEYFYPDNLGSRRVYHGLHLIQLDFLLKQYILKENQNFRSKILLFYFLTIYTHLKGTPWKKLIYT